MAPSNSKLSTGERKEELIEWCEYHSKPRALFKPPKIDRGKKARLKALLPRILVLSEIPKYKLIDDKINWQKILRIKPATLHCKPRTLTTQLALPSARKMAVPVEDYTNCFQVKPKALKYKPTKRIKVLCTPLQRKRYVDPKYSRYTNWDLLIKVKRGALNYTATERTLNLNKKIPKRYKYQKPKKPRPTGVKKSALSATASPRTGELAKPREHEDTTTKKNAFSVRKGALSATATDRIMELAKPRIITPKYVAPT